MHHDIARQDELLATMITFSHDFLNITSIVSMLVWSLAVLMFIVGLLYLWVRPTPIDPCVPGPRRHAFVGVTFSEMSELMHGVPFDWSHWPILSILLSKHYNFQTWGGMYQQAKGLFARVLFWIWWYFWLAIT